jgi:hypothetical protein
MTSTATTKTPLGGSTTNRKWYLDVDSTPDTTATWLGVFGVTDSKRIQDTGTQDDSDMDGGGWKSETATSLKHGWEGKVRRAPKATDATAYDPGQELLRLASLQLGSSNRVHYRIYEMEPGGPRVEAYEGFGAVTWSPDGGNMEAIDSVSVKLLGQGELVAVDHPDAG